MSMTRFNRLWTHPEYAPRPVTEDALRGAEERLEASFPEDYREAVLRFGLPRPTIALLDLVVDSELDVDPVNDFLAPDDIVETTLAWREMDLPADLVAFATDCSGNLFCFRTGPMSADAASPVVLFDHDFGDTRVVAPSFSRWIEDFCALAPE